MYKSEIVDTSLNLANKIELVAMKDVTDCTLLEQFVNENNGEVIIAPKGYVKLHVENDKSDSREYDIFIIVDTDGNKYKTGSESFERAFMDIFNELSSETGWQIKVFGKPSKNYAGKSFLTCSVVL